MFWGCFCEGRVVLGLVVCFGGCWSCLVEYVVGFVVYDCGCYL